MNNLYAPKNHLSKTMPDIEFGKNVVLLSQWQYVKWLAVTTTVASSLRKTGRRVQILDISQYAFPRVGSPQNSIALFLGVKPRIQRFFNNLGFTYAPLLDSCLRKSLRIPEHRAEMISNDVKAQAKSFFRDTAPNELSWFYKKYLRINMKRSTRVYSNLRTFFESNSTSHCVIPNGRYSVQRAARYAAEDSGISLSYIEVGTPNSFYWEAFPVHDRIASQKSFYTFLANSNPKIRKVEYSRWLDPRMQTNSKVNDFTNLWESSSVNDLELGKIEGTINVFFTSSRDEFEALGKDWHLDDWFDQYEAFNAIMQRLSKLDKKSVHVLRVHPNLMNKSPNHRRAESNRLDWIREFNSNLIIIPPEGNTNSYELMRLATRVFVANSTIGLEASALGKNVCTTAATYFDEVADVQRLWNPKSVNSLKLNYPEPNPVPARDFIAYLAMRERPLNCRYEDFHDLDPIVWPIGKRSTFFPSELSIGQIYYWIRRIISRKF